MYKVFSRSPKFLTFRSGSAQLTIIPADRPFLIPAFGPSTGPYAEGFPLPGVIRSRARSVPPGDPMDPFLSAERAYVLPLPFMGFAKKPGTCCKKVDSLGNFLRFFLSFFHTGQGGTSPLFSPRPLFQRFPYSFFSGGGPAE